MKKSKNPKVGGGEMSQGEVRVRVKKLSQHKTRKRKVQWNTEQYHVQHKRQRNPLTLNRNPENKKGEVR